MIISNTISNTISNEIGFSVALSYDLTSPLSATPKSDINANDSLIVSNNKTPRQGRYNYVKVDYEGNDRVGFKIDTSSLASTHQVESFYLVTEFVKGNNRWHVPLGYDDLGHQKRFLTKKYTEAIYLVAGRNESKAGLTLNEEDRARARDFSIPNTIHLLSATSLGISKTALNGILGTFPTIGYQGGEQKIRELIIFTNDLTVLDHSNMVRYLVEKWNIPRSPVLVTNLYSYYGHKRSDVIENVIDGNPLTTFDLNNSPQNAVNGRLLFEFKLTGSVLEPQPAGQGVSTGHSSLILRTGNKTASDTLKAPVKVELLRKADVLAGNNNWYTLTNVAADNNDGVKSLVFNLLAASNDFVGYRLLATGNSSANNGLQIDDFIPSRTSISSPRVISLVSTLGKIYNTNHVLFSNGFTNTVTFDQNVYGLAASDFQVSNGSVQSLTGNNASNYTLVVKPFSFQSNGVGQSPFLKITLLESAVTNTSGSVNRVYTKTLAAFTVFNPFGGSQFDVGLSSRPALGDIDKDGDLDMVSGRDFGYLRFYSNNNNGTYTLYDNDSRNPFKTTHPLHYATPSLLDIDGDNDLDIILGISVGRFFFYSNNNNGTYNWHNVSSLFNWVNSGSFSAPTLGDIDRDGDIDMVSGNVNGQFVFYSNNNSNRTYTRYSVSDSGNPFSGASFDVGLYSIPDLVDIDKDGDLDMVSGAYDGRFWFFSNNNNGTYTVYAPTNSGNPFSESS